MVGVTAKTIDGQREARTHALLDSGSTRSFCTEGLMQKLNAIGRKVTLTLGTLVEESEQSTVEVDLLARGSTHRRGNPTLYLPNVLVIKALPAGLVGYAATQGETARWNHLRGVEKKLIPPGQIELLIGQDVPWALAPLEVRAGGAGEPFAVRTRLGWAVSGPINDCERTECMVSFLIEAMDFESRLETQVKKFWEIEAEPHDSDGTRRSVSDQRVIDLWSRRGTKIRGHYQLHIPFRKEEPELPDNRHMAERRLFALKRRLMRDPQLHQQYTEEMRQLMEKGYAEMVPDTEIYTNPGKTLHIPHHPVRNQNKPGKLRIVFDCAAQFNGVSLNNQVLQGPDLANKLLGVLLRFRQGQVALMADIEAMFHQIGVPPEHRDALRFLWWEKGKLTCTPKVFRMKVHLFGGVWSPSCASYALQRALQDHELLYSNAAEVARRSFYVDDLLMSVSTTREASLLARQLTHLLSLGGFRLTKWSSNNKEVLESIPVEERSKEIKDLDLECDRLPTDRALGVRWDQQTDQLAVKVVPPSKPGTRRGLLSIVSSIYDPLGFIAPFAIGAKIIFQDECRRRKEWDEPLEEANQEAWKVWLQGLSLLGVLRVSRCYMPPAVDGIEQAALHHFCDASQVAYSTVSYLRVTDTKGRVHCSFVFGRARLAPLKQLTIPRLELCAAAMAAKADEMLRRELTVKLEESTFWTDSMIVLQYLSNHEHKFHTFVANRIASILDISMASQWRHVNTRLNPADDATRGLSAEEFMKDARWLKGPDFLGHSKEQWPINPRVTHDLENDPEVKKSITLATSDVCPPNAWFWQLTARYSSWYRLKKGVAWLRRFVEWVRGRRAWPRGSPTRLTVAELSEASKVILKKIQLDGFQEEVKELEEGRLSRCRPTYRLEPFIGDDGLLRTGGRLEIMPCEDWRRCPVLLPRDHHVTRLIARDCHEGKAGHSGREHTIAVLRHNYWIPQCRKLIDKIVKDCVVCRRVHGRPAGQREAPLPTERTEPGEPPFTNTGVDCFGPFNIKWMRKSLKRYGCLFTCLATRAIHLEVLGALDADAFMNALVRFTARRGAPKKMFSDNGTNFTRADKELRAAFQGWKHDDKIASSLLRQQIEWKYIPPTASHMGGVWERQIRTVRKVLLAIVGQQVLDDERLQTLFCEAEAVVNGRPITPVSPHGDDLEALTPAHLLHMGAGPNLPLGGVFNEENYRRRWKHTQLLADRFWKRWVSEYLPLIRHRQRHIQPRRDYRENDMVIVVDLNTSRNQWRLGRVIKAVRSDDGLVRQVRVRTERGTLTRPVTKLCLLEGAVDNAEIQ